MILLADFLKSETIKDYLITRILIQMTNKLEVKKNWFQLNNNWHLLVSVKDRVYHKTVIIYNTADASFESVLKTNKMLKENDLIEQIKKDTGMEVILV